MNRSNQVNKLIKGLESRGAATRTKAAKELGVLKISDASAMAALQFTSESDDDESVRQAARDSLSILEKEAREIEKLLKDLDDSDLPTRMVAIQELGRRKESDNKIADALGTVAQLDSDDNVRKEAEAAMKALNLELHPLTDREILEKLMRKQEEQGKHILEIQKHTGCLYAYLIASLIISGIALLLSMIISSAF